MVLGWMVLSLYGVSPASRALGFLIISCTPGSSFAPGFQSSFSLACFFCSPPLVVLFFLVGSTLLASSSGSDSEAASLSPCASKSDASPESAPSDESAASRAASESVSGSTYDLLAVALALLEVLYGVSAAGRFEVLRDAVSGGDFADLRGILQFL